MEGRIALLITAGTAVCGGSAIAALAPVAEASDGEISVAMGCVFLLNSVALLLFPALGWAMHLSQEQFGLWAALAIHDTSSVVGAAVGARLLLLGVLLWVMVGGASAWASHARWIGM